MPGLLRLADAAPRGAGPGAPQGETEPKPTRRSFTIPYLQTYRSIFSRPTRTRPTSTAVVPLPHSRDVQARPLLHHLLEQGDVVGKDSSGRTAIQLSVDD